MNKLNTSSSQVSELQAKGLSERAKKLMGGVVLVTSAFLTGCGDGIPEQNQEEYEAGKEILISQRNGFEFYKWKPSGRDTQLFLVKYNEESKTNGDRLSKEKPIKLGGNDSLEFYEWQPDGSSSTLYIAKGKNEVSTHWTTISGGVKGTMIAHPHTVSYISQGNEKNISTDTPEKAIQAWLKLSDDEQESLGLPKSNTPRIQTLLKLTNEQRESLGLTKEYNDLIQALVKK